MTVVLKTNNPLHEWGSDSNGIKDINNVEEVGYMFPFLDCLKEHLSFKEVYDLVIRQFEQNINEENNNRNAISDIGIGSVVKLNPLYIRLNGRVL